MVVVKYLNRYRTNNIKVYMVKINKQNIYLIIIKNMVKYILKKD